MTREQCKALLPIMQAYAEGKTIQTCYDNRWEDCCHPRFDDKPERYRIKPEPREWWVVFSNGCVRATYYANPRDSFPGCEVIHVREVV